MARRPAPIDVIRRMAMSFPEVSEQPHFEKTSFRVGKKIFATYDASAERLCVKLPPAEQDALVSLGRNLVQAVPNAWGKQGWTLIDAPGSPEDLLRDALTVAYRHVAPKRLADQVAPDKDID